MTASSRTPATSPWIGYRGAPGDGRLRLVAYPYAGASAQVYRAWDAPLGGLVDLVGLQPPGRWARIREPLLRDAGELAEQATDALLKEGLLHEPYVLYGHSFGAAVALEMARVLHRRGGPMPTHVYLGARMSPPHRAGYSASFSDEEVVVWLRDRYRAMPAALLDEPELLELLLPVLRADLIANESYEPEPEPRLEVPLTVFYGSDDDLVPEHALAGWASFTTGPTETVRVEGGHFFAFDPTSGFFKLLLDRLRSDLRGADARATPRAG